MTYKITQLTQENAVEIADKWHYDGQYAFYDMTADPEDYEEIVTPKLRQNSYYQVLADDKLIGFFVIEPADENQGSYELGLGMKPNLTYVHKRFISDWALYQLKSTSKKQIIRVILLLK